MTKHLLSLAACVILLTNSLFAQNDKLVTKLSADICPCMDKAVKDKSTAEFQTIFTECFTVTLSKYVKEVSAETNNMETEKMSSLGQAVGGKLGKDCPAFLQLFTSNGGAKMLTNNESPFDAASYKPANCKDLLTGKFITEKQYMNGSEIPNSDKKAYSTSAANIWTDYAEGKYKTVSKMKLLSDCVYELTITSNDNPSVAQMMKIGDKITITVLGVDKTNPNKYYTLMEVLGMKMYVVIVKSK